jgi:hypothetical protein
MAMAEYDFKHNIYVLTYLPTGKKYVGKTGYNDDGKVRLHFHINKLQHGVHPSKQFQADYEKYGGDKESFKIEYVGVQWWSEKFKLKHFDLEKRLMLKLKTYDSRYGYNSQDPSMKRWIRKCRMYSVDAS